VRRFFVETTHDQALLPTAQKRIIQQNGSWKKLEWIWSWYWVHNKIQPQVQFWSGSWKRKFRCWFRFRFCKSDPVMVLGNFGLKAVVNCQLTLDVDHFFPKRNIFQKIVNLVLELGLGSSSRTRSGFQFQKSRAGSDLVLGNQNQTNGNLTGQTR
jgi:hypothetical protein